MAEIPHVLVKDLLSIGYFFEELRKFSRTQEIDLASFSRGFAIPYLAKKVESYQRSGQTHKIGILNLAVSHLSKASDHEMADSLLGLRRVATSEVDMNEKAICKSEQFDKAQLLSFRHKSEAAQSLGKLLVAIIRIYKLSEVITRRDKRGDGEPDPVVGAIEVPLQNVPRAELAILSQGHTQGTKS